MNRYRDRRDGDYQRDHEEGHDRERDSRYSPNFRQHGSDHRRWNSGDDWRAGRDDPRGGTPYGVGADAAYGEPDYGHGRQTGYARHEMEDRGQWDSRSRYSDSRPGTLRQVSGQTTEGAFWSPNYGPQSEDRLTGDELRRYARSADPEYENWREDQLRAHDRDYHAWRTERRRAYDDDYANWREERQSKFGQDFGDWRTQRSGSTIATGSATSDSERRTLSASRPQEPDRSSKKQDD